MRFHSKNSAFIALLSLFTLLPFNLSGQSADFQVVPLPKVLTPTSGGNFQLDKNTLISYSKEDKATRRNAEYLAQYIEKLTGMKLTVTNLPAQKHCIPPHPSRSLSHPLQQRNHLVRRSFSRRTLLCRTDFPQSTSCRHYPIDDHSLG